MINQKLSERIRNRRKELKMSQEELANLSGYTDRSTISRIEKGLIDLTESKIIAISKALNVSPEHLVGWTEGKTILKEKSNVSVVYDEVDFLEIPLYGSISAGYGTMESDFIEMIGVPGLKANGNTYFAVKVRGDSMEPKIPNGSIIVIKKDIAIDSGEIGAFYVNDENFVKQKKIIKNKLILHSFNFAYDDIVVNEYDDFKEYGKVVKVLIDL